MRTALLIFGLFLMSAAWTAAQPPQGTTAGNQSAPQAVGTMSELMLDIIHPASDALFYIASRTPENDAGWRDVQAKALTLAESANLLMMPGRTRAGQWNRDARQVLDAAAAAYKAAKARDVAGIEAVSDPLYESCDACHKAYRRNGSARVGPHDLR
jgi:hypothetical protein